MFQARLWDKYNLKNNNNNNNNLILCWCYETNSIHYISYNTASMMLMMLALMLRKCSDAFPFE